MLWRSVNSDVYHMVDVLQLCDVTHAVILQQCQQ